LKHTYWEKRVFCLTVACLLLPSETYSQHTNYRRSIAEQNIFQ
jgi:hypothetical protein